ncbi:MAG: hypothetical protein M0P49_04500 [Bacilli bacterium]|nr:hypothetical protein [Bacilli bacterium]
MLIVGDHKCVGCLSPHIKIYNVSSLLEGYIKLNILPYTVRYSDEKEFDLAYALYILEHDNVFFDMMRIIYNLYIGNDVYLLITVDQFSEIVTESLLKFIQQRYGYIGNRINDPEDLGTLVPGDFTLLGVFNLDQDKERFSYIIANSILSGGGSVDNFDIESIL